MFKGILSVACLALFAVACAASPDAPSTEPPDETTKTCGGIAGEQCATGQWCDYPGDSCGSGDQQGVCQPSPQACTMQYEPVCGCDGKTYGSSCQAASAGTDVLHDGECKDAR